MDIFLVVTAFVFGFIVKQVGLPPLVGFLAAGFVLNYAGIEIPEMMYQLSEVGIILLLFSIGLKVQLKSIFEFRIWGTATIHMLLIVILFGSVIFGLSLSGLSFFSSLGLSSSVLIAFALSFSSTVFAVKILEEKGELSSRHGRLAIGILIIQDFLAVLFITFSKGELPSPYAIGLLGLILIRKPLMKVLDKTGHGELLVLLSCILPIAGAELFNSVGLKPDLGALLLGMLFAGHEKADELAKAMFGFKDLFLVGFFLTIGMADLPQVEMFWPVFILILLLPVKSALFYLLFTKLSMRARTSLFTTLNLTSYSEFGLIVGAIGVKEGWIGAEWLVILAVTLSVSLIIASPFALFQSTFYSRWNKFLRTLESNRRLPEDDIIDIGDATVVILGMGKIGTGAYEELKHHYGKQVIGLDFDPEIVETHLSQGRNIVLGDAGDYDFWQRGMSQIKQIELILLTMSHPANKFAAKRILQSSIDATVAATARYDDEIQELQQVGIELVFDLYSEAGAGLSEHVYKVCQPGEDSPETCTVSFK